MDTEEFLRKLYIAIEVLESLESILISGILISKDTLKKALGNGVLGMIPDLIENLDLSNEEEYEEAMYWEKQFERILSAIEGDDSFFLLDVLMNETKISLIQYRDKNEC